MVFDWVNGRQLSSITYGNNKTATFKYNSDGMRTYKNADGYQTYYYYDSDNNLIALDSNSTIAYFYYDSNGEVTSMSLDDTMYFFIKNQQGDIEKIVNNQGQVYVSYTYDAWGNIISEDAITINSSAHVKDFNPFRYRGYVYDKETGLYYLQSRYYDPEIGRFLNADVYYDTGTGSPLSTNMFAYCENNPVNYTDKTGEFGTPLQWLCATIGGIVGWKLGDYVARSIGFNPKGSFWSKTGYWTVRGLVLVGGSVLGYIGGTALLKVITKFVYSQGIAYKLPAIARWILGIPAGSQFADNLFNNCARHIFSSDHIKNGIMKLGTSQRQIFDKLLKITQSCIKDAQEGSNQIHTTIGKYKVTIRFYIKDGKLINFNAFMGWASRIIGKLIRK